MEGFSTIGGSRLRFFTVDGGCRNWLRIKFKMHGSSCCMAAIEFTDSIRWKSKWIKYLKNHSFSLTCIAGKYSLIGIDWWRINEENQSQNDCQKEKNNGPSSRHFLAESNSTCIRFWSPLWRLCWPSGTVAREKVKAKMSRAGFEIAFLIKWSPWKFLFLCPHYRTKNVKLVSQPFVNTEQQTSLSIE